MRNFDFHMPKSPAEALQAVTKHKGARYKSGGTDLVPMMKARIDQPKIIVDLTRAGMTGIKSEGGKLWVGAMTIIADVAEHGGLQKQASAVSDAALKTATPLVRNRATVAGNLCQRPRCWYFRNDDYPCAKKGGEICYAMEGENKYHAIFENTTCNIVHPSNLAPAFWVHDGVVHVASQKGKRDVKVSDFWVLPEEDISTEIALEPGELVTGVSFTPCGTGSGSRYIEVREKQTYDWALVNAAARVDLDGGKVKDLRLVVSAVAPVPLRMEAAEKVVRGKTLTEALARKAGEAAVAEATPLRDNKYKVRMLKACVTHAILEAGQRAKGK